MSGFAVRPAVLDDAVDVARIKIAGWRTAYTGIVPAGVLDGMDDIRTAASWSDLIEKPAPRTGVMVAELPAEADARTRIVGFTHFAPLRRSGPQKTDPIDFGEVTTLYVDPSFQRRGIGTRLLKAAFARMGAVGLTRVRLWSLAENKAGNAFYERCGGQAGETAELSLGGTKIMEIAYDWPAPATVRDGSASS